MVANENSIVKNSLKHLNPTLVDKMLEHGKIQTIPANTEILNQGQYIKVIPVVAKGLIKVFTTYQGKDLLLYYISPSESCIMSFSAGLNNQPSQILAVTEQETLALLLPIGLITEWVRHYPDINLLFFDLYNKRYIELLDTINHVLFDKMDVRLLKYLEEKAAYTNTKELKLSHRQIANELGTAREVVSRVVKKLEHNGKLIQHSSSIELK